MRRGPLKTKKIGVFNTTTLPGNQSTRAPSCTSLSCLLLCSSARASLCFVSERRLDLRFPRVHVNLPAFGVSASVCFGKKGLASVRDGLQRDCPCDFVFQDKQDRPLLSSSSFSLVLQTKAGQESGKSVGNLLPPFLTGLDQKGRRIPEPSSVSLSRAQHLRWCRTPSRVSLSFFRGRQNRRGRPKHKGNGEEGARSGHEGRVC